jgi:uncharacterized protein
VSTGGREASRVAFTPLSFPLPGSYFLLMPIASIPRGVLMRTAGLLIASNGFMTVAWYGHLRTMADRPWYVAALVSWGIALFEYLFQVPANRIGFTIMTLPQLKVMQEVITLLVFAPFAVFAMGQTLKLDYLWAALCLVGAVYFTFRK